MDARAVFFAGFTRDELIQTASNLEGALVRTRNELAALEAAGRALLADTDRDPSGLVVIDDASLDLFEAALAKTKADR